jgi:hypothetical protein
VTVPVPGQTDPWSGQLPGSVPPGIGGLFVAFGWIRELFNSAIPAAWDDIRTYAAARL